MLLKWPETDGVYYRWKEYILLILFYVTLAHLLIKHVHGHLYHVGYTQYLSVGHPYTVVSPFPYSAKL